MILAGNKNWAGNFISEIFWLNFFVSLNYFEFKNVQNTITKFAESEIFKSTKSWVATSNFLVFSFFRKEILFPENWEAREN